MSWDGPSQLAKYLGRVSQVSWDVFVPTGKVLGTRVPPVTNELGCGNVLGTRVPTAPMSWDGSVPTVKGLGTRVPTVTDELGCGNST